MIQENPFNRRTTCATCGEGIDQPETGRPRLYCSNACKDRAPHVKAAQRTGQLRRREDLAYRIVQNANNLHNDSIRRTKDGGGVVVDTDDAMLRKLYRSVGWANASTLSNGRTPNDPRYLTVDHVEPLSKGGSHSIENVQIMTRGENLSKGDR